MGCICAKHHDRNEIFFPLNEYPCIAPLDLEPNHVNNILPHKHNSTKEQNVYAMNGGQLLDEHDEVNHVYI
jgi:hypothetical protein